MSGPPPPPPPHGQNPKTTTGSGLPPGNFDIFIIPDHSSGGGFLYLPSLRPSVNSFAAGFATALVLVVVTQSLAPAFQAWWAQFNGIGNIGMMLLTIGIGVGAWALGRTQGGGGGGNGSGFAGFGPTPGPGPGTFPNSPGGEYSSPPPQSDARGSPPPRTSPQGGMPNGSWQQRPPQTEPADAGDNPEPQPSARRQSEPEPEPPKAAPEKEEPAPKAAPKPEPEPEAQKNAWERAREETRRREEEKRKAEEKKKKAEAEAKRKQEAQRRLKEMRARDAMERKRREKEAADVTARAAAEEKARVEREEREQEERARLMHEKEQRERELAELKEARRVEKERREKAERELNERLEKERKEKELRDQRAREIKERLEHEAREKERMEKIKREQEILERERQIRDAREREQREREEQQRREREALERESREREARKLKEEQENATRKSTYAYTSVGEKTSLWPNGKPNIPHPPPPASASGQSTPARGPPSPGKRPPAPTARTDAGTEDAYSYRPYDKPKARSRRKSNSSYMSDTSWAPSQSTSRTTPPPSTRSGRPSYSTSDPDKIVIRAVYGFLNSFAKTPASQLLSGMAPVTDGLILRITTEGLFIDDDVRRVPQREWDVKAWTLKQVDVWCACHSVVAAATAAAVPNHLHKSGPRPRPSERGTKTLNGPDADDYLQALRTTCENNCKVGLMPEGHEVSGPHLHVLRATLRDQEGKRYLFVIPEEESWKMAIGLQRLRGSSQVRTLGVSGMARDEACNILSTLGF
ncbi:hypothetical protein MKZ38_007405 [Zalerion maritima]|uniref:Uncharacterized protein n=1 Tax=Zalerion maritima TaxID=339359 RepID=A0AAD5RIS8_9PEZI|nr:hypothetical protein MKZ38_007405 [Zalerion maritima]